MAPIDRAQTSSNFLRPRLAIRHTKLAGHDKPPEKIGYTVQPPTGGGREAIGTERSCFSLGPGRFSLPVSAYSSIDVCAISRPAGGPSFGRRLPKGFALSDADDYKRFIERCFKLARKAKGVSEEKALLEIAWRFAQLAHRATIKRRADKPKLK